MLLKIFVKFAIYGIYLLVLFMTKGVRMKGLFVKLFIGLFVMVGVVLCLGANLSAKEPYNPAFSLNVLQGLEPPPLPQVYGIDMPDIWGGYEDKSRISANPLMPSAPVIMEACAITGRAMYAYADADALMHGCYRGDAGLSYLQLQPYEYWDTISGLSREKLLRKDSMQPYGVRVVLNFKGIGTRSKSIEIGDVNSPNGYIAINGEVFYQNFEIARAIYSMIYEINEKRF